MRFLGGLALGCLAAAAHLFDGLCRAHLGTSFNVIILVLITGYVTTALRQARRIPESRSCLLPPQPKLHCSSLWCCGRLGYEWRSKVQSQTVWSLAKSVCSKSGVAWLMQTGDLVLAGAVADAAATAVEGPGARAGAAVALLDSCDSCRPRAGGPCRA